MATLADLRIGERAHVASIDASDAVGVRLLEMGITPGVEVEFISTAPLGDPLEFELRGYRLSLRKAEAKRVLVNR